MPAPRRRLAPPLAALALAAGGAALLPAGAAAAPKHEAVRPTPVGALAGTWAWRDLDEALSLTDAPVSVRIAVSGGRPVFVFPGGKPVRGRWNPRTRVLRVTAPRPITGTGEVRAVRYILKVRVSRTRTRAEGTLVIRARAYPGISAVTATLTARAA